MRTFFVYTFFLLLFLNAAKASGQSDSVTNVVVSGVVLDAENSLPVPNLMVVNARTQQGFFGDNGGEYRIVVTAGDRLIFAATGYTTISRTVSDPENNGIVKLDVRMQKLSVQLKEVEVFTQRDLQDIYEDIEELGFEENDYMISGVDAISSPITYLYQQFSRKERNKRMVAEMRNNDRRRDLLKELFRKYVDEDIINLEEEEFDSFIDFSRVSDEFLQRSTQYEFIMYIKKRFEVYQAIKDMQ